MNRLELRKDIGLSQAKMAKRLGKRTVAVSLDDFARIRQGGHFYVDKTRMIADLLAFNPDGISLFARPRRFGKSLNLSMLYHFFSNISDPSLFDGLEISKDRSLCERHQNHYPAILLSLKDVHGRNYESFIRLYGLSFSLAASKFSYLLESEALTSREKDFVRRAIDNELAEEELCFSLRNFSRYLHRHHGVPVAIFVDEYDVPLEKASHQDCYPVLLYFMQVLFSASFKSNEDMAFGVLTGCLRESKENLFTGFNNAMVYGLLDDGFASYFGFTREEVSLALSQYGLSSREEEVKRWYDGYRVGGYDLYCPYDICCLLQRSLTSENVVMESFWRNSSANELVYDLLAHASPSVQGDIDALMAGKSIVKNVDLALSYRDLSLQDESVWGLLLATGYLTVRSKADHNVELVIPNLEVMDIFHSSVLKWVKNDLVPEYAPSLSLVPSLLEGDKPGIEKALNTFLKETIGVHDYAQDKDQKEAFYHALTLGLLSAPSQKRVIVKSNAELGEGYPDIYLYDMEASTATLIEIKYADGGDFKRAIEEGLAQIHGRHYEEGLPPLEKVHKVVLAFYKKRCVAAVE